MKLRSIRTRLGNGIARFGKAIARIGTSVLSSAGWSGDGDGSGMGPRSRWGWLKTYETSSRLHSVVSRIAEDVAGNKWTLFEEKRGGDLEEIKSGPLFDFLNHPWISHGGGSWHSVLFLVQAWLELTSEAFLLIRRDPATGLPVEILPIPPSWVHTTPFESRGLVYGVVFQDSGKSEWVPASEMIWIRRPAVSNPFGRGVGRAEAVANEVVTDDLVGKHTNSFFRNGARPDLILFLKDLEGDPTAPDRFREDWDNRHRGVFNHYRPAFLPEGNAQQLSSGLKDLVLAEIRTVTRDITWQTWQMSPECMGAVENSNRASIDAAQFMNAHNLTRPRLVFLQQEFAYYLLPLFQPAYARKLSLIHENPVRETQEFMLDKFEKMFARGAITRGEFRQKMGMDLLGDDRDDDCVVPLNTVARIKTGFLVPPVPKELSSLMPAEPKPAPKVAKTLEVRDVTPRKKALPPPGSRKSA